MTMVSIFEANPQCHVGYGEFRAVLAICAAAYCYWQRWSYSKAADESAEAEGARLREIRDVRAKLSLTTGLNAALWLGSFMVMVWVLVTMESQAMQLSELHAQTERILYRQWKMAGAMGIDLDSPASKPATKPKH